MRAAIIGTGCILKVHMDALIKLEAGMVGVFDIDHANAKGVTQSCGSRPIQIIEEILGEGGCNPPPPGSPSKRVQTEYMIKERVNI